MNSENSEMSRDWINAGRVHRKAIHQRELKDFILVSFNEIFNLIITCRFGSCCFAIFYIRIDIIPVMKDLDSEKSRFAPLTCQIKIIFSLSLIKLIPFSLK